MCASCLRSLQSNRTKETQKNVDTYVHPDAKEQDTQVDQNEAVEEAKDVSGGQNETELPSSGDTCPMAIADAATAAL